MGRMARKSAVQTDCYSGLTPTVALTTSKIEVEEEDGKKSDAYYPEIIEIMPGHKLSTPYITHNAEIHKEDSRNYYRTLHLHDCSVEGKLSDST